MGWIALPQAGHRTGWRWSLRFIRTRTAAIVTAPTAVSTRAGIPPPIRTQSTPAAVTATARTVRTFHFTRPMVPPRFPVLRRRILYRIMIANLPPGGKTIGAKNALPLAQGQFTCPEHCNLRRVKPLFGGGTQTRIDAAASRFAPKTESQSSVSGCDSERRSSKMSALRLIKEVGASDMTLAPTWSRVRESNPPQRLGKPLYYRCTNPAW